MNRFTLAIAAAATAIAFAHSALAEGQYVDQTGFAVSGYDVVAYRDLSQEAIGSAQPAPVPGKASITADYNGATFAFSSEENRETFLSDPARYAPQYDGHCAYGAAKGGKVPGNPTLWRIVDDKLYLNITKNVVGFWEVDIPGNISLANGNWPALDDAPGSERAIPKFTSSAPLK
ncbi:MAG: YHS domain-containing protein [Sulfitobacter sp.]|nr:YHS domain-containing protein [Sulfitobacter sp.]